MKSIKRNFQGVRFSDVLLSALSISFQNYFESKGDHIPNTMTVVVPARIEAEGNLKNTVHPVQQKNLDIVLNFFFIFFILLSLLVCNRRPIKIAEQVFSWIADIADSWKEICKKSSISFSFENVRSQEIFGFVTKFTRLLCKFTNFT